MITIYTRRMVGYFVCRGLVWKQSVKMKSRNSFFFKKRRKRLCLTAARSWTASVTMTVASATPIVEEQGRFDIVFVQLSK